MRLRRRLMVGLVVAVTPVSAAIAAAVPTFRVEGLDRLIQVPTSPPADLVTLQWVVIVALVGVVGYLYRQNVTLQAKNVELLMKVLEGLATSSEFMRGMKEASENAASYAGLRAELERLLNEKG